MNESTAFSTIAQPSSGYLSVAHLFADEPRKETDLRFDSSSDDSYSDIQVIYGVKFNRSTKKAKPFPIYDEATKENFSHLVKKYDYLINAVVRKRVSFSDFDEAKQTALCILYYYYNTYDPRECEFTIWLCVRVKNAVALFHKKKHSYLNRYGFTTDDMSYYAEEEDIDILEREESVNTYSKENINSLRFAINDLPKKYREIAELHLSGYSDSAIAARLGKSTNLIAQYLFLIRQAIYENRDKYFTNLVISRRKRNTWFQLHSDRNSLLNTREARNGFNLTLDKQNEIVELLKQHSSAEVQRISGISLTTIKKIAAKYNLQIKDGRERIPDEIIQKIEKYIRANVKPSEISKKLKISAPFIQKVRENLGLAPLKPGKQPPSEEKIAIVTQMYSEGFMMKSIREKTGLSQPTVLKYLKQKGLVK